MKRENTKPESLCGRYDLAYRCKEKARQAGPVSHCGFYSPKNSGKI